MRTPERNDWEPSLADILDAAELSVAIVARSSGDDLRQGGYFNVYDARQKVDLGMEAVPPAVLTASVGAFPSEEREMLFKFSKEKGERLLLNPRHISGWQSRDDRFDQFGGAIRAGSFILSFSGLPEHFDESAMLLTAIQLGLIGEDELTDIIGISRNDAFTVNEVDWLEALAMGTAGIPIEAAVAFTSRSYDQQIAG